ncbi:glycosyltransferase family 2 protein [Planctomycetota bacterium]|nr:glycosyltransferase family 2 protein [Planctomycetota bacterium]
MNFEIAAPSAADWFVVFNPDIETNPRDVLEVIDRAIASDCVIAAPLLWNAHLDCFDQNARPFPTLSSLLLSFVGAPGRSRYDEKEVSGMDCPDWVSGAFLAIRADTFRALGGFDERYFMYMEDVDLCLRARRLGGKVRFFPEVKMIHNARRGSRSVFDRLFWHHLASSLRYFARQLRR